MRKFTVIDNVMAHRWGLTLPEAYVFEWMWNVPGWAEPRVIDNAVFFWASKNKAVQDLPIITDKVDTMYRYYKKLESKGLVELRKIDKQDFIRLTEKAKSWNNHSDSNPTKATKSESIPKSEKIPSKKRKKKSDENPTNRKSNSSNNKKPEKLLNTPSEVDRVFDSVVGTFDEILQPTGKGIENWKQEIEKLIRIDKMTPDDVIAVVKWGRGNSFWRKNFQSIRKLRKKNGDGVPYWKVFFTQMTPVTAGRDGSANFKDQTIKTPKML